MFCTTRCPDFVRQLINGLSHSLRHAVFSSRYAQYFLVGYEVPHLQHCTEREEEIIQTSGDLGRYKTGHIRGCRGDANWQQRIPGLLQLWYLQQSYWFPRPGSGCFALQVQVAADLQRDPEPPS